MKLFGINPQARELRQKIDFLLGQTGKVS